MTKVVNTLLGTEGVSVSTHEKYRNAFKNFKRWYKTKGKDIMGGKGMDEGDEDLWLLWLAHEYKNSTFSSIKSKLCGIKHNFRLRFGFDPFKVDKFGGTIHFFKFERAYREIKRQDADRIKKEKLSLTKFLLLDIEKLVDKDDFNQTLSWTVLVIGVCGLLRWSEIAHTGRKGSIEKILDFSALTMKKKVFWLKLKDTKTKLFGDKMTIDFHKDNSTICPVATMKNWLKIRPKKSTWLFCYQSGKPARVRIIQKQLKLWLADVGYTKQQYNGGISLRKGGALTMALCGVPDRVIRAYGRWKSYAYRIYIDLTHEEKLQWQEQISRRIKEKGQVKDAKEKAAKSGKDILKRVIEI